MKLNVWYQQSTKKGWACCFIKIPGQTREFHRKKICVIMWIRLWWLLYYIERRSRRTDTKCTIFLWWDYEICRWSYFIKRINDVFWLVPILYQFCTNHMKICIELISYILKDMTREIAPDERLIAWGHAASYHFGTTANNTRSCMFICYFHIS